MLASKGDTIRNLSDNIHLNHKFSYVSQHILATFGLLLHLRESSIY